MTGAPLAGVIRKLEANPVIDAYFAADHVMETNRFRQVIGVIVRIVMERRGWKKSGRKGSKGGVQQLPQISRRTTQVGWLFGPSAPSGMNCRKGCLIER